MGTPVRVGAFTRSALVPRETLNQVVRAHFEEIVRLLRDHPEKFDQRALERVAVVAGLAIRVTRLAARGRDTREIVREVAGTFLEAIVASTKELAPNDRRTVLRMVAGARRGYVSIGARMMALEARHHPTYRVEMTEDGGHLLTSGCPRCGQIATRSLERPDPCSACGFVFVTEETP